MAKALMLRAVCRTLLSNWCRAIAEPRSAKLADRVATLDAEPRQRRRLDPRRLWLLGNEFVRHLNFRTYNRYLHLHSPLPQPDDPASRRLMRERPPRRLITAVQLGYRCGACWLILLGDPPSGSTA